MGNSLSPDEMSILAKVIDDACLKLGCDEAQREAIAARVTSCAAHGARDYETLFAVATFQHDALSCLGGANAA